MNTLRIATLSARQRTGDTSISTRVDKGRVQVVSLQRVGSTGCRIVPVSDWLTPAQAADILQRMTCATH
jgi:hypothetical protein